MRNQSGSFTHTPKQTRRPVVPVVVLQNTRETEPSRGTASVPLTSARRSEGEYIEKESDWQTRNSFIKF